MSSFFSSRLSLPALAAAFVLIALTACKDPSKPAPAPTGDPELDALNALIQDRPSDDSLRYLRAKAFYRLEAYDEAIADATRAIQLDSVNHPAYYRLLSDALLDYGRPGDSKRAIEVMRKAVDKFPNNDHNLLKLSEFYLIVRQHNEALSTIERILQRDPLNAEAFFMTGRVALDMGDTTRSITAFQKSVQFDSQNKDAWIFLGRLLSLRRNPAAIQCFDNAIRLDSTDIEAQEFKAAHYKLIGQYREAFEIYNQIAVNHPDYSNVYYDKGVIYLELDSLQQAWRNFDLAIKTDPLFVIAYYYRGVVSEAQGNLKAAFDDYTQANKMSPALPEPQEGLKRLAGKGMGN